MLTSVARLDCGAVQPEQLRQAARAVTDWPGLIRQAEGHGLAPLLYTHLQAVQAPVPERARRMLQALYWRHQRTSEVRQAVLGEALTAFARAGIETVLLKGAALVGCLYPAAGLRPMRDIDLLVPPEQARPGQRLLSELGFAAPLPETLPGKHMPTARLERQGLVIGVEVHHNLFQPDAPHSFTWAEMSGPPLAFTHNGVEAHALCLEDMLWHLCRHAVTLFQPLRLIYVADIVGLAETYQASIDWARVRRRYPFVVTCLAHLHDLTPLSAGLQARLGLTLTRRRPPAGVGREFTGWPRASLKAMRRRGWLSIARETLWPPAWWLGLYYGSLRPGWYRWVGHPWHMGGWGWQWLMEQTGWRTPLYEKHFPVLRERLSA